jgi:UDP-GlcNAc:undecaprenyl-phosphate/decaprenyl-phosphate GlcNAc-1-phosphate transferase
MASANLRCADRPPHPWRRRFASRSAAHVAPLSSRGAASRRALPGAIAPLEHPIGNAAIGVLFTGRATVGATALCAGLLAAAGVVGLLAGLAGAMVMLARARRGAIPVDLPDSRRLHEVPTPRGGGIGVLLGGALAAPLAAVAAVPAERRLVLVTALVWALPVGLLGWLDDFRPMRSRVKFAVQAAAALGAALLGLRLDAVAVPPLGTLALGWAAWPVTVLWLVWVANVFNFMDGMDALAAGSGLLFAAGFTALALPGSPGLAALALAFGASCLGFLRYNWPPARIFMGDGGSLFAGALLAGLSVALTRPAGGEVPIAASVLLLGTFAWDATYTIGWRLLKGEPMRPHRTHLFQRLALAGWSHGRVRALYLGLGCAFAAGAVALPRACPVAQGAILAATTMACLGLVLLTSRQERK